MAVGEIKCNIFVKTRPWFKLALWAVFPFVVIGLISVDEVAKLLVKYCMAISSKVVG